MGKQPIQRVQRRSSARQRGQAIPIMALAIVILTGFAALNVNSGLAYMQYRGDQDITDAAALAATYRLSAGDTLSEAYTAASNLESIDGCGSSCSVPYLELWTASAYTSSPDYYFNNSGSTGCATSVSGPFSATCPSASAVKYVGAPASDQSNSYFGEPNVKLSTSAIAEVPGGSGGSGGTGITFPCQICVLDTVSMTNSLNITTTSGAIDINNGVSWSGSSCAFSSAGAINLPPKADVSSPSSCTFSAGSGSSPNYETADWMANIWKSTGSSPAGDPLSGSRLALTGLSAGKYCTTTCSNPSNWTSVSQTAAWNPGCCGGTYEISPGTYYGISTSASNTTTLEFDPGVYYFFGSGMSIAGSTVTLENTPSTTGGVTLYFSCASGNAPASCAAGGAEGATFSASAAQTNIDLTAPTSGADSNMLFWFDPYNEAVGKKGAAQMSLAGDISNDFTGAIYMASGTISASPSDQSTCNLPGPIIVKEVDLGGGCAGLGTGNGSLTVEASPSTPGNLVA